MTAGFGRELLRKLFHMLSLVYLAVFAALGREATLWLLGAFFLLDAAVESARLRWPELNRRLLAPFRGITREHEAERFSGIYWTTLGCWLAIWAFGGRPRAVAAGLVFLAAGDAAAALVGRAVGRLRFRSGGRMKSVEGSAACFVVCALAARALGFGWPGALAGAAAATVVELLPVPFDDNLWLPLVSAAVLYPFAR